MLHGSALVDLGLSLVTFVSQVEILGYYSLLSVANHLVIVDRLIMDQSTLRLICDSLMSTDDFARVWPISITDCTHVTVHEALIRVVE